jgi:hypothetical protein
LLRKIREISGVDPQGYLPGLILLASPTATLTYVMAKEMNGDEDFAVAALSLILLKNYRFPSGTFHLDLNLFRSPTSKGAKDARKETRK